MHENERILKFSPLIRNLYNSARESLGFEPHVSISIIDSSKNANNPLGKTAHYSPSDRKIALYTRGRHIKDIMRSLAHELVHHNQNCRGDFETAGGTMPGYAQEDGHLREMEREAYEVGNLIFRDWEDKLKDKGGKPLFSSTAPYVPAPTSGVVGGRLLEENTMKNNLTKSQLQELIAKELKELMEDKTLDEAPRKPYGQTASQLQQKATAASPRGRRDAKERSKPASQRVKELGVGPMDLSGPGADVEPTKKGLDPKYIPGWGDDPKTAAPKPKRQRRKHSVRIESIQQYLVKFGYDLGPHGADGYKGRDTRAAIEKFQRDNGLAPDGIVGPNTINKMEQVNNDLARAEKSAAPAAKAPADKADKGDAAARHRAATGKDLNRPGGKPGGLPVKKRMAAPGGLGGPKWAAHEIGRGGSSYKEMEAWKAQQDRRAKKARSDAKLKAAMKGYSPGSPLYRAAVKENTIRENQTIEQEIQKNILENILKDNDMKKEIKESQLRNMIRGVIQEMFEEDLNEDNMGMPANAESQEASEEDAEAAAAAATTTASGGSTGEDFQVGENLKEDSGEEEKKNYKKNVKDDKEHLKNLEKDIKDDEEQEKLEESFFPKGRSTREKARKELNESLMKRWGFTKKEK